MSEEKDTNNKGEEIEQDPDLVFEDMDDTENPQAVIKKLRARLKESTEEKQTLFADLQRTKADFINLRKRDEKEKEEFVKFASAEFLESLIPVLDSFDHAITEGKADESTRASIEPIFNQLMAILEKRGVERIDPRGEMFDPNCHEAIATAPVSSKDEDQRIIDVLQRGYVLSGRVVRPAKVRVGEYKGE